MTSGRPGEPHGASPIRNGKKRSSEPQVDISDLGNLLSLFGTDCHP